MSHGAGFAAACQDLLRNQDAVDPATRLRRLFDLHWSRQMADCPEMATFVGAPGQNHRWTDRSLEAIARRKHEIEDPLRVARALDRGALGESDRLSLDLFIRLLEEQKESARFPDELIPVTQLRGVQQEAAQVLAAAPAATVRDYEDMLSRLQSLPESIDQTIRLMDEGLRQGVTAPRVALRDVPGQVRNQITADPLNSPVLEPFTRIPADIPVTGQARLRAAAAALYGGGVRPAWERLLARLVGVYLPDRKSVV